MGKRESEISGHFSSVGGTQVKGSEISNRRVLAGFWKNAWPTWRPRREDTQEPTWRGRTIQLLQDHGRADLFPEDLGQVVDRDSRRQ